MKAGTESLRSDVAAQRAHNAEERFWKAFARDGKASSAADGLDIITMQRRWRLQAIENNSDGALILASAYDHSLFVGETRASGRSKRTQLHSGTYRNFNLVTNHRGRLPVAQC